MGQGNTLCNIRTISIYSLVNPFYDDMKIIHKEKLKQITFLDERFYFDKKTESYHPSATTILDVYPRGYGYIQWLKDLGSNADEVMKRAGDKGTKIHEAIEDFFKGKELKWTEKEKENYTLDEWMMLLRFFDFYETYKPNPLALEISLVSPKLGFGGTLDLVCTLPAYPKDIWYIDWKSGGGIYKSHKIQGASYWELWNSQEEQKITRAGCLHLRAATRGPDKTGKKIQGKGWKIDEIEDQKACYRLFGHAQAIWKEENPNPKPKNIVYPDRISMKGKK